jgi:hypothetical protein
LTILTENIGEEHPFVADAHGGLGELFRDQGRFRDAESHYRISLAIREKLYGSQHPEVVATRKELAVCLRSIGRDQEAEALEKQ